MQPVPWILAKQLPSVRFHLKMSCIAVRHDDDDDDDDDVDDDDYDE